MAWYFKGNCYCGFGIYVRMPEGYDGMVIDDVDEAWNMMEEVFAIEEGWA